MKRTIILPISFCIGCGSVCGDGVIDKGEACDDGNLFDADGCEADCSLPACGNGIIDPGEFCFEFKGFNSSGGSDITISDLNSDNLPDIAISSGDSIRLFFNETNQVSPERSALVGGLIRGVISADFDGDGNIDLATLSGNNQLAVLLGDGTGTFSDPTFSTTQLVPEDVTFGDFNADESLDIAVSHSGVNSVGIFEKNIVNQFSLENAFPLSGAGASIRTFDENQDGDLDFLVTLPSANLIEVLENDGAGTFTSLDTIPTTSPNETTIADFNNDGQDDIAVTSFFDNSISIFVRNKAGDFAFSQSFGKITNPINIVSIDFDSDGDIDLVSNSAGDLIFLRNEEGSFLPDTSIALGQSIGATAAADLNQDKVADIVSTLSIESGLFILFSNP